MADEKTAHFGQQINVLIKHDRKATVKTAVDASYVKGVPPSFDEQKKKTKRMTLSVYLKNALVPYVECPVRLPRKLLNFKPTNALHEQGQFFYVIGPAATVRAHYRQACLRYGSGVAALPWSLGEKYGVRFVLADSPIIADDIDSKWMLAPPPTDPDQLAAWNNPLSAALLSTSNTSTVNFWWTPFNDWARNFGFISRATIKRSSIHWKVENINPVEIFEPFDPFDTTNFKVTAGLYTDPEVIPAFTKAKTQSLVIILVPKLWSYHVEGVQWAFRYAVAGPLFSAVEKRTYTQDGLMYPLTSPFNTILVGANPPSSLTSLNTTRTVRTPLAGAPPTNGSSSASIAVTVSGLPKLEGYTPDPTYSDPDNNSLKQWLDLGIPRGAWAGVDNDTSYSGSFPEELGDVTALLEMSDCLLRLQVADTPTGALVGIVVTDRVSYVYRRSPVAAGSIIYEGGYDGLRVTDNLIRVTDDLLIPSTLSFPGYPTSGPVSASRSFEYFDPGDHWLHESY
jgi:hypothetical protein